MLDTGLAARIRAKGVRVVEVAGWHLRGRPYTYQPRGGVNHHTAGSSSGRTPSLATVIYGRSDVPGPLAQVLQSREPDPSEDIAYVVAAGTCNHAGSGGWRGLSGNTSVGGLEVEHPGTSTVPTARLEIAARIIAAIIEAPGSPRDAGLVCQHFEWTTRKIDFHDLAPWTAHFFRQRVAYWVGRTTGSAPSPSPQEDDMTPAQAKQLDKVESRVGPIYFQASKAARLAAELVEEVTGVDGLADQLDDVGEDTDRLKAVLFNARNAVRETRAQKDDFDRIEAKLDQLLAERQG